MNKIILSLGFGLLTTFTVVGQSKITILNETDNISGQAHTIKATDGSEQKIEFQIHNESTKTQPWLIKRVRLDVPQSGWDDNLCWGPQSNPLEGSCYTSSQMPDDLWITPEAANVPAQEAGLLQVYITPDAGSLDDGHYRYYVGVSAEEPADSVDIIIKREAASIVDISKNSVNISLYPNPAADYLQVSSTGINQNGTIKIMDVLGKVIVQEKFTGSKKYIVREFKNGVYIMTVATAGKVYSKRFVVKHH